MNYLKTGIGVLIFYSASIFASVNCPSTQTITNSQFITAEGAENIWDLFSQQFRFDNQDWQVIFTVYLPGITSKADALREGTYYFNMNVIFSEKPWGSRHEDKIVCYYAQQESSYFVRALSQQKNS